MDAFDKDWALSTKELRSWGNTILAINVLHGAGLAAWLLNMLFDNQGGVVHYIYYRMVQLSYVAPIVDFALTMNIHRAYVQSATEELADIGLEGVSGKKHSV